MIYLDHHATTPIDPAVLDTMLPFLREQFGNPGSTTHLLGRAAKTAVEAATQGIADQFGCSPSEIVFTSGATESNNLACFGYCLHPLHSRKKIVSIQTEHRAILDPLNRLAQLGFQVEWLPVRRQSDSEPGSIDWDVFEKSIDDKTAIVSVMLANNEIGVIHPLSRIAGICRKHGAILHTDATQAVGRLPIRVDELDVDMLSFSSHKFYGPRGIGGLYVRNRGRRIRLLPQILGGGQQENRRSGTLNVPGIVGTEAALRICHESMTQELAFLRELRDRLWILLRREIPEIELNGPALSGDIRLVNNLNCFFPGVEGQAIAESIPEICVSTGSACTSAEPRPSHVLLGLGRSEDEARCSLRFGLGRFNSSAEIETAASLIGAAYHRLRKLG